MSNSEQIDFSNFIGFIGLLSQIVLWLSLDASDSRTLKRMSEILILILFVLIFKKRSKFAIPSIIIIGAMIRMSYHSYTSFQTLYGGDAPMDFFLASSYLVTGEISIVSHEIYDNRLGLYSAWPLSQLIVASTSMLSEINVLVATHVIRMVVYLSTIAVIYSIVVWFSEKEFIRRYNSKWALVVIVFMPEMVYWQMEIVRQNLGILAHVFFVFTLLKLSDRKHKLAYTLLMFLSCCLLAFSHNLTSAISVLFLVIFLSSYLLLEYYFDENHEHYKSSIINSLILLSVLTMLWMTLIGEILFPKIRGVLMHFYLILTGSKDYILDPSSAIPPELSPDWIFFILPLRDIVIMGFTAVGFLLLCKEKIYPIRQKRPSQSLIVYTSMVISYVVVFAAFFFWTEPFRVLTLVAPLMAISFAFCIEYIIEKGKNIRSLPTNFIKISVISSVFLASILAPFSHTYAPLYLYDDEIENMDYGEPSINSEFAVRHLLEHSSASTNVSVDFPDSSIQFVDMRNLSRFFGITGEILYEDLGNGKIPIFDKENEITLLIRNGSIYNPSRSVAHETGSNFHEFAEKFQSSVFETLNLTSSKVYDVSGGASIWFSSNSPE